MSLLVTLAAAIVLGIGWLSFDVRVDLRTVLQGDQRNLESYEKVNSLLGEEAVVVLSLECDDVFSTDGMDTVRRVSEALLGQAGCVDVKSFTHAVRPVRRGLGFEMVPLVSQRPDAEELAALREYSLAHPLIRGVMVSPDGRRALILANYRRALDGADAQKEFAREMEEVLGPFRAGGVEFRVLAKPLAEQELRSTLRRDAARLLPGVLIILGLVMGLQFRSVPVLALVVFNLGMTFGVMPAVAAPLGISWTIFTVLVFPILGVVQLTLMVHFCDAWQRARGGGAEAAGAPVRAVEDVIKPSLLAVLTTGVGMGSLGLSPVEPVRAFGLVGALGVSIAFLQTFGPGLAVAVLMARRGWGPQPRAESGMEPEVVEGVTRQSATRPGWIRLLVVGAVLVFAGVGLARIRTDVRIVEFLDRKSPTRQAIEELDAVYGGINVVPIEVDTGRTNGVNDPGFLRYLEGLGTAVAAEPGVSAVYSYAQLLGMMNEIWEGGRPGTFRVPDNPLVMELFTIALRSYELPFRGALVDDTFRTTWFILRTRHMASRDYLGLIERVVDRAVVTSPEGVRVSAARGLHSILEADRRILRSQVWSAGGTVLAIAGLLGLMWRSWRLAAVGVGVTILPVAVVISMLGHAGLPLNSITVMVAAVCLGIAVDHAVHCITVWRDVRRRGLDGAAAVEVMLAMKRRPILASSLALAGVFACFGFSQFPPIRDFGLLCALAMLASWASVMGLLTWVLRTRFE